MKFLLGFIVRAVYLAIPAILLSSIFSIRVLAQDIPTPHSEYVCPDGSWGGDSPSGPSCGGTSGASNRIAGPTPQQQMILNGAQQILAPLIQQGVHDFIYGNPQEQAAQQAAAAAAQAEAARRAAAAQAEAERRAAALEREIIGGTGGDLSSTLTPMGVSGTPDLQPMPPATVPPNQTAFFGISSATPALLSTNDAADTVVGPELVPTKEQPEVPTPTVSDYTDRATRYIAEQGLGGVKKAALKGELFAEGEMGPYGFFTAVMINASQLPSWEMQKIGAAVRGELSLEEIDNLPLQATNRLFDVGSSANQALRDGAVQTAFNISSEKISSTAKEGLASLATSYLSTSEEAKQSIAENAPKLADNLVKAAKFWTTAPANSEEQ